MGFESTPRPWIDMSAVLSPSTRKERDHSSLGMPFDFAKDHAKTTHATNDTAAVRPNIASLYNFSHFLSTIGVSSFARSSSFSGAGTALLSPSSISVMTTPITIRIMPPIMYGTYGLVYGSQL